MEHNAYRDRAKGNAECKTLYSVRQDISFSSGLHRSEQVEPEDCTFEKIAYAIRFDCS